LIHDRDPLFTATFGEVFKSEELQIITTLPQTPRMNATCERVIGTLRHELLDRILILDETPSGTGARRAPRPSQRFTTAPIPATTATGP
jgi:hypothetical protein